MILRMIQRCGFECQHSHEQHLESHAWVWCQRQVTPSIESDLVVQLDLLCGRLSGDVQNLFAVAQTVVDATWHHLRNGNAMQQPQEIVQECGKIAGMIGSNTGDIEHLGSIAHLQCGHDPQQQCLVRCAKQGTDIGLVDVASAKRDALIQKREGITHTALRCTRNLPQGGVGIRNLLCQQHGLQILHNLLRAQILETELQTSREDRDRQLVRIGGGQQEDHMGRRLFQRLEQGIEAVH